MSNEEIKNQYNDEEQLTDVNLETDTLDEEVGDGMSIPEDIGDEDDAELDGDESTDDTDSDSDDQDDQPNGPAPEVQRLQGEIHQLKDLLGMVVQQMQSSQAASQYEQELESIVAPDDVEEYSQQDAITYAMRKAQEQTKRELAAFQQQVAHPINVQNEVLNILLNDSPKGQVIRQALTMMNQQRIPFKVAYQNAESQFTAKANQKLGRENNQLKQSSKRRREKAKRATAKPTNVAATTDKKYDSTKAAILESCKELGIPIRDY